MKTEAVKVRMDAELRRRLDAACEADQRAAANLMRIALERFLDEEFEGEDERDRAA
jgi:predicted transcriptional regulator